MKPFKWQITFCLLFGMLLMLCACGSADNAAADIARAYADQSTVKCTLHYTVQFDAVIDGIEMEGLQQVFSADVQADLVTGNAYLLGEMSTVLYGEAVDSTELESYAVPSDPQAAAYYRYGTSYSAAPGENAYLSIVNAPLTLNLDTYEKAEYTELLYGSECHINTGRELADDTQKTFVSSLTEGTVSLEGCTIDVILRTYAATSLPAQLQIDYSNLADMDIQFSDAAGNSYTLTGLSYEVLYNSYGTPVDTNIPDGFREAALKGEGLSVLPDISNMVEGLVSIEDVLAASVTDYTGAYYDDFSDSFFIYNENTDYFYVIDTPEYMEFDEHEHDYVSFYYFYEENDFEIISYYLYSGISSPAEANYAEALPALYQDTEGISDVSDTGVQSITIGDYAVQYNVIYYTLEMDGEVYDTIDIYSWVEAPNGEDCLEVNITEYNGYGDGLLIDPVEELQYAYASIAGSGKLS